MYVYLYSLHVSGNHVPIIRRIICVNAIRDICHSVWMTVWYAGWNLHTRRSSTYTVTYTRYRTYTDSSPDDGYMVVRNM